MICHDGRINYGDNLIKGEHFGEIRLLFNCPRTCNVMSKSYNILGQLDRTSYQSIINEYPKFDHEMKKYIFEYKDPFKNFFYSCLCGLSYFKENKHQKRAGLTDEQFHDLIYLFEKKHYDKGETVMKEMQITDRIYIIGNGQIKFYTNMEGVNDFEVLSLGSGTVINHRNVLIDSELFRFHAIATEETIIYEITKD